MLTYPHKKPHLFLIHLTMRKKPAPRHNKSNHRKKTPPVPDSSDDEENPVLHHKKSSRRKKPRKKSKVIESEEEGSAMVIDSLSDENLIKRKPTKINLATTVDMDVEEIKITKESAEEELGQYSC